VLAYPRRQSILPGHAPFIGHRIFATGEDATNDLTGRRARSVPYAVHPSSPGAQNPPPRAVQQPAVPHRRWRPLGCWSATLRRSPSPLHSHRAHALNYHGSPPRRPAGRQRSRALGSRWCSRAPDCVRGHRRRRHASSCTPVTSLSSPSAATATAAASARAAGLTTSDLVLLGYPACTGVLTDLLSPIRLPRQPPTGFSTTRPLAGDATWSPATPSTDPALASAIAYIQVALEASKESEHAATYAIEQERTLGASLTTHMAN
jgi:hypothetical protein